MTSQSMKRLSEVRLDHMLLKRLVLFVVLAGIVTPVVACGDNVPPKGDHDAVKPAPVSDSQQPVTAPPVAAPATVSVAATQSGSSVVSADRVVSVGLQDESSIYVFNPAQLSFAKGETVSIELTSQNEFHSFTVDSLGLDVEVEAGESTSVTYTFDTVGTYDLICIPHESLGMVGTITVQ